jgi:hypothetical protein
MLPWRHGWIYLYVTFTVGWVGVPLGGKQHFKTAYETMKKTITKITKTNNHPIRSQLLSIRVQAKGK